MEKTEHKEIMEELEKQNNFFVKHSDDDDKQFGYLRSKLDKHIEEAVRNFERFERNNAEIKELLAINGEHFSSFNKTLEEIKEDNRQHQARVEPMLLAYERDTQFSSELEKRSKKWSALAVKGAGVIGAYYVIKAFIVNMILK